MKKLWKLLKNGLMLTLLIALTIGILRVRPAVARVSAARDAYQLFLRLWDELLMTTPAGQHYAELGSRYGMEIIILLLDNPELQEQAWGLYDMYAPGIKALLDNRGETVIVTQEMVDTLEEFLDNLSAAGSEDLAQDIAAERELLPLQEMVGMTMAEAWEYICAAIDK